MSGVGTITTVNPKAGVDAPPLAKLREVAGQVVGSTFYGRLLSELRSSGLKGEYGHGGRGEEVFQAQLDEILSERMGESRGFNLAEAIYNQYANRVRTLATARQGDGGES